MHRQPKAVPWKRDPQVTGTAASDITTPRALPGATSADITKTATPNRGVPATSSAPLSLSIGSAKRPWQSVIAARLAASNAKAEGDVITTSAGGSGQVTNGNTLHQITNDNTEHQFTNDKTDDHQIANGKTEGEHQTTNANKNEVLMQEMATTSDMDMELAATVKRRRPRLSRLVTKAETVAETAAATATPSSRPAYLTKPVFIAPSPFTPSSAPLYTLPTGMTTEQLVSVLAATGNMGATSGSGLASTPHHHQYPPHLARLAASDIMSFSFGNNNNSSSAAGKRRPRNGGMTPTIDYAHPYTHKRAVAPATRQSITELIDRCDQGVQRAKLLEMEIAALKEKAAGGDGQDVDATTKMTTSSMMRTMSPAAVMVSGNAARVGMGRSGDHAFAMVGSPVSSSTGSTGIDAAFK